MRAPARLVVAVLLVTLGMVGGCALLVGIDDVSYGSSDPRHDAAVGDDAVATARCQLDQDCRAPSGCFTGRCDTSSGRCAYDECRTPGVCSSGSCDVSSGVCGARSKHAFAATRFSIAGALGCNGNGRACMAAVYPFVFVGLTDHVLAIRVSDVTTSSPQASTVLDASFPIQHLIASGSRLLILGGPAARDGGERDDATPSAVLAMATLEVPESPLTTELRASVAMVRSPFATARLLLRAGGDAFVVASEDEPRGLVARFSDAVANGSLDVASGEGRGTLWPTQNFPAGASIVAADGDRLLARTSDGQLIVVIEPASAHARAMPATAPPWPTPDAPRFASSRPVAAAVTSLAANYLASTNGCGCTMDQLATTFDITGADGVVQSATPRLLARTELVLSVSFNDKSCGEDCRRSMLAPSIALLDRDRALVATYAYASPMTAPMAASWSASVAFADGGDVSTDASGPRVDLGGGQHALATSAGLGFALTFDAGGADPMLAVVDPACP